MTERGNKPLKSIVELDPEEGLRFVQWAMMRVNIGHYIPESEWRIPKITEKDPKETKPLGQQTFWIEDVGPQDHVSPVYGVVKNE